MTTKEELVNNIKQKTEFENFDAVLRGIKMSTKEQLELVLQIPIMGTLRLHNSWTTRISYIGSDTTATAG